MTNEFSSFLEVVQASLVLRPASHSVTFLFAQPPF